MKPMRVQLSRKDGWEKPPNTVVVSRPSRFGNPFKLGFHTIEVPTRDGMKGGHVRFATRAECVDAFRADIAQRQDFAAEIRKELAGKNLACWCRLCSAHRDGKPLGEHCEKCDTCHADVLLEAANA
jgi:hypothetical protein